MVPALVCRAQFPCAQYPVVAGPGADSLRSGGGHSVREEVEIFLGQRHTTKLPSISAAAAVLGLRPFPWAGRQPPRGPPSTSRLPSRPPSPTNTCLPGLLWRCGPRAAPSPGTWITVPPGPAAGNLGAPCLPSSPGLLGSPLAQGMLCIPQGPQPSLDTPGLCLWWSRGRGCLGKEAKYVPDSFPLVTPSPVLRVQPYNSMCSQFRLLNPEGLCAPGVPNQTLCV